MEVALTSEGILGGGREDCLVNQPILILECLLNGAGVGLVQLKVSLHAIFGTHTVGYLLQKMYIQVSGRPNSFFPLTVFLKVIWFLDCLCQTTNTTDPINQNI